ncbi:hypothetical protein ACTXG7_24555 [Mycolicibacterium sp. Dal123E01]|uniref:hypothetical protein n=1 Tax=Mycolicibacterium sp. Dal123E01 TaxID=3457578 RepID=UPI00403E7B2A
MLRRISLGVAVFAVVALAVAGCGGSDESSSTTIESTFSMATTTPSAPSSAAAQGDYSSLLIKPSDIGPDVTANGAPGVNPGGVTGTGQVFETADRRDIIISIAVLPDAAAAAAMIQPMKDTIAEKVDGQQQPVDIGSNGFMVEGPAKKKSMQVSEVVFTQGRALVDLEYDSALGNPAPSDAVLEVARKQAAAVAAGLPS